MMIMVDMIVLTIMTHIKDDYNIVEDYEIYMLNEYCRLCCPEISMIYIKLSID